MKPKAYEGNKPYVFISYAHKDTELVFRVMNSLQEEGYRIWYDDGIMPGSEWPENIAQHLDAASMVISMVTPNSMDSHNCRREINFALSRRKPFLALVLEPTKMSLGMEMQLSAQHNIYLQNYTKWDDFIDKILVCEDLIPCKEEVVEAPAEESAEPVVEAPVVQKEVVATEEKLVAVEAKKPAKVAKPKKEKPPKVKKEKAPKPEDDGTPKKKKPIGKILLGVVACVALVAALVFGIKQINSVEMSWGTKIEKSATSVYVQEEVVQQSDLERLMALSKLKSVTFMECDFNYCDFSAVRFKSPEIYRLEFENCTGMNDYEFLRYVPMQYLTLTGCENFTDLSILNQSDLRELDISGTGVTDLSALTAQRIYMLKFNDTPVSDVSHLMTLPELETVSGRSTAVTNIDALAELVDLEELDFSGCAIEQVRVPFDSLNIRRLRFADCGVADLSGFVDATRLTELNVIGNPELTDLSWLNTQNEESLSYLYLGDTGLAADDIAFVAKCVKLQKLNINGISVDDLALCKRLPELKSLYAANCGLKDISDLKNCTKLETLALGFNEIEAVDALKGLENLREADLSFNKVKTLASLADKRIRTLLVHGNDPALAATIPGGLNGYNLSVDWHVGVYDSGLKDRGAYTAVYLMSCPSDQVLNTQDVLGRGYCNFTDTAAFVELAGNGGLSYIYDLDYSYALDLYQSET